MSDDLAGEATLIRAAYANRCLIEIDAGTLSPDQLVAYVVARLDDWDAAHPEMARLIREAGEREPTC